MDRLSILKDFIESVTGKEVNKRTIENFIKAGALDCLEGTAGRNDGYLQSDHGQHRAGEEEFWQVR